MSRKTNPNHGPSMKRGMATLQSKIGVAAEEKKPPTAAGPNHHWRKAAHEALDRAIDYVESETAAGRKFYGAVVLRVTIKEGMASDVHCQPEFHVRP